MDNNTKIGEDKVVTRKKEQVDDDPFNFRDVNNQIWISVPDDISPEKARYIQEVIADRLGAKYQIIVAPDSVEVLSSNQLRDMLKAAFNLSGAKTKEDVEDILFEE